MENATEHTSEYVELIKICQMLLADDLETNLLAKSLLLTSEFFYNNEINENSVVEFLYDNKRRSRIYDINRLLTNVYWSILLICDFVNRCMDVLEGLCKINVYNGNTRRK